MLRPLALRALTFAGRSGGTGLKLRMVVSVDVPQDFGRHAQETCGLGRFDPAAHHPCGRRMPEDVRSIFGRASCQLGEAFPRPTKLAKPLTLVVLGRTVVRYSLTRRRSTRRQGAT